MPATVPTQAEFDALAARVTALEQGTTPAPEPPPGQGVQAKRIHALIETLGVNTFSSLDEHNVWGSWPADYRPDSVAAGLRYLTADTAYRLDIREYHYAGRSEMQAQWLREMQQRLPGTRVSLCVAANGSPADATSMRALASDPAHGIGFLEGINEPNTDFGSGTMPIDQTLAIQREVWGGPGEIMGPSIVAGMPHPEGWITGYCGNQMDQLNELLHWGNGHYYPPACCDLTGDGTSLTEYVTGLQLAYADAQIQLTEWHPSLYNAHGHKPDQSGWNGTRDAYYTLLALCRAAKLSQCNGLWWYALYDYGQTYRCGFFPVRGAEQPRPAATAIRNLCTVTRDTGQTLRSFTPGKLDYTVSGLPQHADHDLYQASDGRFFLLLWRAAQEPGGSAAKVTVSFGTPPATVVEYDPVRSPQPVQSETRPQAYYCQLNASCRVLVVSP